MNPLLPFPIDHIGIAVHDLEAAISWYKETMHGEVSLREQLPEQGVTLAFIDTPSGKIELLAPLRPDAPLGKFLAKRGPGLHHLCFQVKDIEHELTRLSARGTVLIDATPRHGAGGGKIAFLHPSSCMGVLTELVQLP